MYQQQLTPYRVKKGDTLESIARRIGLKDYRQLRKFHNNVCPLNQLLRDNNIVSGRTLFIPIPTEVERLNQLKSKKKHKEKRLFRSKDQTLTFPTYRLRNQYDVVVKKKNERGSRTTFNRISYVIQLKFLGNRKGDQVVGMSKDQFYVNGSVPITKIDELAIKCGKTYYPMNLVLDEQARVLGLLNWDTIHKKWLEKRDKLKDYYYGEIAHKYISNVDKRLKTLHFLNKAAQDELFMKTLTSAYHKTHHEGKCQFSMTFFKENFKFNIEQEISRIKKSKQISVVQRGTLKDHRTYKEILTGISVDPQFDTTAEKVSGEYQCQFIIDEKTKMPIKIEATWHIKFTHDRSRLVKMEIEAF